MYNDSIDMHHVYINTYCTNISHILICEIKMLSQPVIAKGFYKMANNTNLPDLCNNCRKNAAIKSILFCKTCHKQFCYKCGSRHVNESGHELVGLCGAHRNILDRFCELCKSVICRICEARRHFDVEHHVIAYRDAIAKSKEDLGEIMEVGDTVFMALLEQICKVSELKVRAKKEKERLFGVVSEVLRELNFVMCDFEIRNIKDTIRYHQNQIELMNRELKAVERRKLTGERVKRMKERLERDSKENLGKFDSVLVEMKGLEAQLRNLLLARVSILPAEKILTPKLLDDITETKKELQDLTTEADRERLTPLKSMLDKTTNFLNEDYIRSGRFFRASLQCHLKLPCDDFVALGFVCLAHDRIAACGKGEGVHAVWLWNSPSTNPSVLITDTTCMPYMAKAGDEELVILRTAQPMLRVINVVTKATRDIEVKIPLEEQKCWQVAADDQGHFFVTYGSGPILMIDHDGTVLKDLEVENGDRLTFCGLRNSLVTCSQHSDVIKMFRVKESLSTGDGASKASKNHKQTELVGDDYTRKIGAIDGSRPENGEVSGGTRQACNRGESQGLLPGNGYKEKPNNHDSTLSGDKNTKIKFAQMSSQERLNEMVRYGDYRSFFEWVQTSPKEAGIKDVGGSTTDVPSSTQTPAVLPLNGVYNNPNADLVSSRAEIKRQGSDFCCVTEEIAKDAVAQRLSNKKGDGYTFAGTEDPKLRTKSEFCRTETSKSIGPSDITSGAKTCNSSDKHASTGATSQRNPGESRPERQPRHKLTISEVESAAHGVEGFICWDICSGSYGEIFVAGLMEGGDPREVRVYQIEFDLEGEVHMTRIETPGVRMSGGYPHCAVQDNRLVLSDRYTVRVFILKQ